MSFRFGSLFAGVGGIDLGLEWAGMECAWQVEKDVYCLKALNLRWPDIPKFEEVRDVGRRNLETVDLIAGGFPCQPHSVAGKRRGAEDDRNLWPEFIRIIRELKPRYVLAENVPGITTTYLDTVLSDLESQAYTCATFNIPACAFDAPHRRERIFIVAYTKRNGWEPSRQQENGGRTLCKTNQAESLQPEIRGITETVDCPNKRKNVPDSPPLLGSEIERDEQDGVLSEVQNVPDTDEGRSQRSGDKREVEGQIGLCSGGGATKSKLYPTPQARDWRSGKGADHGKHAPPLSSKVGGQLNPTWVEWLMGFPLGWTDLEHSETP